MKIYEFVDVIFNLAISTYENPLWESNFDKKSIQRQWVNVSKENKNKLLFYIIESGISYFNMEDIYADYFNIDNNDCGKHFFGYLTGNFHFKTLLYKIYEVDLTDEHSLILIKIKNDYYGLKFPASSFLNGEENQPLLEDFYKNNENITKISPKIALFKSTQAVDIVNCKNILKPKREIKLMFSEFNGIKIYFTRPLPF